MVEMERLTVFRGKLAVVEEVDLQIRPGEVVALFGRNGSGRSTLLEGLAGLHRCQGGLRLGGKDLVADDAPRRFRAGVVLCPDDRGLFPTMSVADNLRVGALQTPRASRAHRIDEVLARFPLFAARGRQQAGSLSGGEQRLLAICRCLVAGPRLLLLDEPTAGLAPANMDLLAAALTRFRDDAGGMVLFAEDTTELSSRLGGRGVVLRAGRIAQRIDDTRVLHNEALWTSIFELERHGEGGRHG